MRAVSTTCTALDHAHMARALQLAERGRFTTRPNPMVGCVLAHGSEVVGEGWHQRRGEAHAEVHALRAAGARARGATAYVTLEPCAHHGRTPPCADALVAAGVARVVVATGDPFPQVDGQGLARLRAAGVAIDCGLMGPMARALNAGFFSRIERARPWLRLKLAMSLDGRTALADGSSKWITGEAARNDVQRWRARSGALLTGAGTVRADDPQLTVRLDPDTEVTPPLRVVLDSNARLASSHRIFDASAPSLRLHAATVPAPLDGVASLALDAAGAGLDLHAMAAALAGLGINEIQVEAGATLSGALLRAGLVDELLLYVAPVLLGARARPLFDGLDPARLAERVGLRVVDLRHVGVDLRLLLQPETP
jgi:diaminohydroxyphosphoribosylaminopyrimidine deaminase/5-amino-6-(5-phosphoribosylamino)uracil reductase